MAISTTFLSTFFLVNKFWYWIVLEVLFNASRIYSLYNHCLGDGSDAVGHVCELEALLRGEVAGPAEIFRDDVTHLARRVGIGSSRNQRFM